MVKDKKDKNDKNDKNDSVEINKFLERIKKRFNDKYLKKMIVAELILKRENCSHLSTHKVVSILKKSPNPFVKKKTSKLIDWHNGEYRKKILGELNKIETSISSLESEIKDLKVISTPDNNNDIFNNKQQNINIQNKLIYLIRYKYNLFLSILIVGLFICMYKYIMPKLNINENIAN